MSKLVWSKTAMVLGLLLLIFMTCLYCVLLYIVREQLTAPVFIVLELLGVGITLYLIKRCLSSC